MSTNARGEVITIPPGLPATEKQLDFLKALRRGLHMPERMLDDHAVRRFGVKVEACDRAQVSSLIDELQGWEEVPAGMKRAMGQQDMFPEMGNS